MHQTDIAMIAMLDDRPAGFAWAMDGEGGAKWNADCLDCWISDGKTVLIKHKDDPDAKRLFEQVWRFHD